MAEQTKLEELEELRDIVQNQLGDIVFSTEIRFDELSVTLVADGLLKAAKFLKEDPNCRFDALMDISGVDYPSRSERFEVVYQLLSVTHNIRIRLKVRAREEEVVSSLSSVFPTAGWHEREVWDMYGIAFAGNPDLRRILTDYGFEGHPLRKDFPLTGFVEVRYDEAQKRVVYEPVRLQQDFRQFDFASPWEGKGPLPGDEKADTDETAGA